MTGKDGNLNREKKSFSGKGDERDNSEETGQNAVWHDCMPVAESNLFRLQRKRLR